MVGLSSNSRYTLYLSLLSNDAVNPQLRCDLTTALHPTLPPSAVLFLYSMALPPPFTTNTLKASTPPSQVESLPARVLEAVRKSSDTESCSALFFFYSSSG